MAFTATAQQSGDFKPANLSMGVHPAVLVGVKRELVPDGWEMGKKHGEMWRWVVLAWENQADCTNGVEPETLEPVSSPIISFPASSGGQGRASKAFVYLSELHGQQVQKGQVFDFDTMFPVLCQVMTSREVKNEGAICKLDHFGPPEDWQKRVEMHPVAAQKTKDIKASNDAFVPGQPRGDSSQGSSSASGWMPAPMPGSKPLPDDDIPF